MGGNTFLISDTHWDHQAMYERPFLRSDGTPLRPWGSAEEADEIMVERWNRVVGEKDNVIHLGDVSWTRKGLGILSRLNGRKTLVLGNHENQLIKHLGEYFAKIYAYSKIDNFALSHVPMHVDSVDRFDGNIHGHLHAGYVTDHYGALDDSYLCVCVEHTDYTPIAWEEVRARFAAQQSV